MSADTEALLKESGEDPDDTITLRRQRSTSTWLPWLLGVSVLVNLVLGGYTAVRERLYRQSYSAQSESSIFAATERQVERAFPPQSDYGSVKNLTHTDKLWNDLSTTINSGFIAVNDARLPPSDVFPWDQSKQIYVLNSFHLLHCLQVIYQSVRILQQSPPLSDAAFAHTIHCLDALKEEVECKADDTPYILNGEKMRLNEDQGITQTRTCRNWADLERFVVTNSACFVDLDGQEGHKTLLEWRNCPAESPYSGVVERYFEDKS